MTILVVNLSIKYKYSFSCLMCKINLDNITYMYHLGYRAYVGHQFDVKR